MNYQMVEHPQNHYVEALAGDGRIENEDAALELVAACGEFRINRLLIHAETLPEEFYNLRTGLAGKILLKFGNYSIKVAAILAPELVKQDKFQEMTLEANRFNRDFHVFFEREKAEEWLVK